MNGWDIQKYQRCVEIATSYGLKLIPKNEAIFIKGKYGKSYGALQNIDAVFGFLCGYDWGKSESASGKWTWFVRVYGTG